jgi:hypothetical protein
MKLEDIIIYAFSLFNFNYITTKMELDTLTLWGFRFVVAFFVVWILFYIFIIFVFATEGFTDKNDHATAVVNWFGGKGDGKYTDFRTAMGGNSDILEYDTAKKMHADGTLTVKKYMETL